MQIECLSPGYLSFPNLSETPWLLPRRERQGQPGTCLLPLEGLQQALSPALNSLYSAAAEALEYP